MSIVPKFCFDLVQVVEMGKRFVPGVQLQEKGYIFLTFQTKCSAPIPTLILIVKRGLSIKMLIRFRGLINSQTLLNV